MISVKLSWRTVIVSDLRTYIIYISYVVSESFLIFLVSRVLCWLVKSLSQIVSHSFKLNSDLNRLCAFYIMSSIELKCKTAYFDSVGWDPHHSSGHGLKI